MGFLSAIETSSHDIILIMGIVIALFVALYLASVLVGRAGYKDGDVSESSGIPSDSLVGSMDGNAVNHVLNSVLNLIRGVANTVSAGTCILDSLLTIHGVEGSPLRQQENVTESVPVLVSDTIGPGIEERDGFYVVSDSDSKERFINAIKQLIIRSGDTNEEQSGIFWNRLEKKVTGSPIYIFAFKQSENQTTSSNHTLSSLSREKRSSERYMPEEPYDPGKYNSQDIRDICMRYEEVLYPGEPDDPEYQGNVILMAAQGADNPTGSFIRGGTFLDNIGKGVLKGGYFIFTLGIGPAISKHIANERYKEYHKLKGNDFCVQALQGRTTEFHARVGASAMSMGGPMPNGKGAARVSSVPGGKGMARITTSVNPVAAFIRRNSRTNIKTESTMYFKSSDSAAKIFVRPKGKDVGGKFKYETVDPSDPSKPGRKIIFHETAELRCRYADDPSGTFYKVTIEKDKRNFIDINGESYQLYEAGGRHSVRLKSTDGKPNPVSVFMNPLSIRWHMAEINGKPLYTSKQQKWIKAIGVKPDPNLVYLEMNNYNQNMYGSAKVWRASSSSFSADNKYFVEMSGHAVPVETVTVPGHGVFYEVVKPNGVRQRLTTQNDMWVPEPNTSPHVSSSLRRTITKDMIIKNVDSLSLTKTNQLGVKQDKKGNLFVNVENGFVKMTKRNANRWAIDAGSVENRVIVRYNPKKNMFYGETVIERLKNILKTGLNGKKTRTAQQILEGVSGFTKESAAKLLDEYDFPKKGFFSAYDFALEYEETGARPDYWATRFHKTRQLKGLETEVEESVTVSPVDNPAVSRELKLGESIGGGEYGEVFIDASDNTFVVKRFFSDGDGDLFGEGMINVESMAKEEAGLFRKCYGEKSAEVFNGGEDIFYLRMYRIQGSTLRDLPENSLPRDAPERFLDMIERLKSIGILHDDINSGNIIWDSKSQRFYPIDIHQRKTGQDPEAQKAIDFQTERRMTAVLFKIKDKIVGVDTQAPPPVKPRRF